METNELNMPLHDTLTFGSSTIYYIAYINDLPDLCNNLCAKLYETGPMNGYLG